MNSLIISASIRNAIIASLKAEGKAASKTDAAIQAAVDAMTLAVPREGKQAFLKGNSRTNPAKAEVAELFASLFPDNAASARCYATSFWIAFEEGVPFARGLYNRKKEKAPSDSAAQKPTPTKGADQEKVSIPKLTQSQLIELVTQECAKSPNFSARLLTALADIGLVTE